MEIKTSEGQTESPQEAAPSKECDGHGSVKVARYESNGWPL
ncbi:hypothetical protein Acife_0888 [Acidithiobacillus ferrivorans SS3]|uniref:Uncharacterized protein n=1 Tax=Acidithiobacillus ferrivorans SS3 TaxID=743299 RepID=G0JMN9_9PROT|nr:hypothetical protein [Acidithiobacillus ferrivorans]AEM47068.1 hypothetical protein Acife_0888 [Acidithiobacillus ferrivorans SS3]